MAMLVSPRKYNDFYPSLNFGAPFRSSSNLYLFVLRKLNNIGMDSTGKLNQRVLSMTGALQLRSSYSPNRYASLISEYGRHRALNSNISMKFFKTS
jgi:hypothetical protein